MSPKNTPLPAQYLGLKIIVSWTFVLMMVSMLAATKSTEGGTDTSNGSTPMRSVENLWCKEHA
jgi:hypothetical protein